MRPFAKTRAGREWLTYGNAALLELPVIEPLRCSRYGGREKPDEKTALENWGTSKDNDHIPSAATICYNT